jgi:hypothetical protein
MTAESATKPTEETRFRAKYDLICMTQVDAARALGRALIEVETVFGEMDSVCESDNFDDEHEETKDLLASVLRIIMRSTVSAKDYLRYKDPTIEADAS